MTSALAVVLAAASANGAPTWAAGPPHLLVDDDGFARVTGLSFEQQVPQKDPVWVGVVPEHPWEMAVQFYTALLQVPAGWSGAGSSVRYHLYYACADGVLFFTPIYTCLAVSDDGLTFRKPLLDLFPYAPNGSAPVPTNRVFRNTENSFFGSLVLTRRVNASTGPLRAVMVYEGSGGERFLSAAVSDDGLVFRNLSSAVLPGLPQGFGDTQASIVELGSGVGPVDPATGDRLGGGFAVYGRQDHDAPGGHCGAAYPSLRHSLVAKAVAPGGPAATVAAGPYGNATVAIYTVPGADPVACFDVYNTAPLAVPGALLALPSFFWHIQPDQSGAPMPRAAVNDGVMDVRLLTSRDGASFRPVSRAAFIPRGVGARDPGSGLYNASGSDRDAGFVFATTGGIIDPVDTAPPGAPLSSHVWLLYWGSQTTHAGGGAFLYRYWPGAFTGILRARLRREGFVALTTGAAVDAPAGEAVTRPRRVNASGCGAGEALRLRLNYAAETGGNVTVGLLDQSGRPVPGFGPSEAVPLRDNEVRGLVAWNATGEVRTDLTPLDGTAVSVALAVANAKVFAWQVVCEQPGR